MKNFLFKIGLGFVGLFFLLLVVGALFPLSGNRFRNGAKRVSTRNEIKTMTWMLDDYIKSNDHLPVGRNAAIISALSATYTNDFHPFIPGPTSGLLTNSSGELVDYWQVPFQIQIVGTTNFIFRSAGKDKIFSNADDIIFNSVSNDFVKP
jgi:hypothetical protein